jgi:hypothetical protein
VRAIYAKLGVHSRVELARVLLERTGAAANAASARTGSDRP